MKTNMINTNSVIKSICAVVMLLGMSVSAWGAKTGTIEFGNAPKVIINSASVTGDDSQGNTWTITTAGTSSYTPQSTYSQVGSSSYPATSITFTMTLPSSKNITAFSAKFGGFKDTAGTIKLKVGDTEVGSGSLSGTSDVTVSNSSTASGTVLTVTVTSISKGVKCYYISCTYANTSAYTVTFDAEGGTCSTSSLTEASIDGGVILPAATANAASYGWGFYGWAESPVSTIASSATIVGKAGDTYYPTSATTLHAVYAKGEYTKVTSTSEITVGSGEKYLIMGYDDDNSDEGFGIYAMTHESFIDGSNNEYMYGYRLGDAPSDTYSAAAVRAEWRYAITKSSTYYYFQNIETSKYVDTESAANRIYTASKTDSHKYIITYSSNGYCKIKNNATTYSNPYLNVFDGDGSFSNGSSGWEKMMIYKETETPKYCSNPSTVRLVASPAAGGTVVFDDNNSAEMDFATDDGYIGDITTTPNEGYDFLNWVSSDESAAVVGINDDPTTGVIAESSATITAHFYQNHTLTYILAGVDGDPSNPTAITKDEKDDFVAGFNLQAHYKDMTLVSVTMGGSPMTEGSGADYEWEVDGSTAMLTIHHANIDGDIEITVSATHMEYTKYAFSCSELTLTPHLATTGTPIFITSTASKTVRSQDYIEITGNGLTPSTALIFPSLPSEFAIKNADGTAVTTDVNGVISTNAYIFYTPDAGDTSDGLDKLTGITVSVGGAKPKTVVLTQDIIGRHLPADFVIAAKYNKKWYALPSNMASTTNPKPSEIAVNDINNPSVAYTATSNIYGLEGPTTSGSGNNISTGNGQYIRLTMSIDDGTLDPHAAPLFGSATGTRTIGKSGNKQASSHLSEGWWWALTQTNTSISNPQDAKYTIKCANNTSTLSLRDNAGDPDWGLFASGVEELRLIPASDIPFTEAYFVEWGRHGGVIEVDAQGIDATSVTAHLGVNSATTTLSQTLTSGKSRASKYNYTVNFGNGIDFAAAASNGAMLTLEWKKGETVKAMTSLVVPKIIASSATMSSLMSGDTQWETEVHVLPGVTLTANAGDFSSNDVLINHLEIYPGATVVVTKGAAESGTLKVKTLILRNGWTRVGAKAYDVARLYITPSTASLDKNAVSDVWYSDWYIDYDQYYPVAVPWDVTLSGITYRYCSVEPSVGPSENIRLKYYDGESRATNVQEGVGSGANWKTYDDAGCTAVPTKLEPSKGYAMTAKRPTGKAFSIIRMPLTIPSADWISGGEKGEVGGTHKDQVSVTAWGTGSTPIYAQGWNFIANPYMALYGTKITHSEGSEYDVTYVNIPDINFKEYGQYDLDLGYKLLPSSGFFIQASKTGTLTFGTTNRSASAPTYRTEGSTPVVEEQKAYIVLNNENGEDVMGLKISENYTADYEINADLEKLLGDGTSLRTYMRYGDMNMAYVAINEMLAKEWIPVSVRIPADGEYTFSLHEASKVSELEGVYLIDYQNGDKVTNLIEQSYTFSSTAGTINGRFAINAKAGERQTPTGIDAINAGGDLNSDKPFKFIYHDKVYIWLNGVIYDTTGKRVK